MAVSKITCPECSTVLRPAKPLPAGKPVKCPECGHRFPAPEEEAPAVPLKGKKAATAPEAAERKPKKAADAPKAAPKKPAEKKAAAEKKPAAKKAGDDEEGGVYGYLKEDEDEEENKPDIEYAPDMSVKDLRGPAQALLVQPSNALIIVGLAGFFGWVALIILHVIPIVFPVEAPADPVAEGAAAAAAKAAAAAREPSPLMAYLLLSPSAATHLPVGGIVLLFVLMVLGMIYSAFLAYGAVRIQNLEGYGWGVAGSVLAIIPGPGLWGFASSVSLLAHFLLGMAIDDQAFLWSVLIGLICLVILAGSGVGAWVLTLLRSEKVIKGYEYEPD